tara:strand:+ start:5469 stop:5939 length:471 start_codon:yes stop_codon:yes gene_type:complete
MANVNHSSLTDPYIHEPKGAATAAAGRVYVANGTGSGAWTAKETLVGEILSGYLDDVSTASTVYIPIPYAGTVSKIITVLEGSISGANSTVTLANSAGASMGTLTITQSGSAAGDVDTLAPSANNSVTADSFITVSTDGASSTHVTLRFTIVLDRS